MNNNVLQRLFERKNLTQQEARELVGSMAKGELTSSQIAAVVIALRMKGETVDEIAGFIEGMRDHMVSIPRSGGAIDTCGTGGDGVGTFNISTAVAFVVAGARVRVAKHGNRAASSRCGSADVLESLGVNMTLTAQQAATVLAKVGMVFLFAPLFHPAMKQVAIVRKELGVPTVFNMLGPFVNPARVRRQLIGVPHIDIAKMLAHVATKLNYEHLLIVSSEDGPDEISLNGKTHAFEVKRKRVRSFLIDPRVFGMRRGTRKDLLGADAITNASVIRNILSGERGPRRDVVVLNSAFALMVSGKVKNPQEGIARAQESIDSGKAIRVLERLREETNNYV